VLTFGDDGLIEDGAILIRAGRVEWVGPTADVALELARVTDTTLEVASRNVLDFGDATIMPGLIDAHVHLTLFADRRFYEAMACEPDEMMALVAVRNLDLHLRAGVTTVRDNGSRNRVIFSVQEALRRGYFRGPRIIAAGRPITQTGGHFGWCNGEVNGPDDVRREVRRLVADGADHIKLMASGGGTIGSERDYAALSVNELRAAVDTAHGLGRLTTAHCHATVAIENAIEAGVDCIEHAEFNAGPAHRRPKMFRAVTGHFDHQDMVYDPRIAARIVERGINISFTPQAGGYEYLLDLREQAARGVIAERDRLELDGLERKFEGRLEILAHLLRDGLGGRLAISTDAGCFDGSFGKLHLGLELAMQAGMCAEDALRACTVNAARICGIDENIGRLAAGLQADVIVVSGNPLLRLENLASPLAVYQNGLLVAGAEPVTRGALLCA
jgi:imidazolonepropionase-like amidohydrolase